MVMNRLAVALLIIAQTAKNPTPIIVTPLTSKVHNPPTLTPQRLRISMCGNQPNEALDHPCEAQQQFLGQREPLLEAADRPGHEPVE